MPGEVDVAWPLRLAAIACAITGALTAEQAAEVMLTAEISLSDENRTVLSGTLAGASSGPGWNGAI